jgi:hypothetical protein
MFSANGLPRSIPVSEVGIMIAFKIAVGVATNPRADSLLGADPDDRRIFGPLPEGHRPRARLPIDVECGLRLTRRPDQDGEATIAAYEIAATFPFDMPQTDRSAV